MKPSTDSDEINLIREELEILMNERQALLKVTGVAAGLIAELKSTDLPVRAVEAADLLATAINQLPEESLLDALNSVHASIIK